jgi:hypothetical protein
MVEDGCGGSAGERRDAGRVAGRDGMMQESTVGFAKKKDIIQS